MRPILAKTKKSVNFLRSTYPSYFISKNKVDLTPDINLDGVLTQIQSKYKKQPINTIDGVKIEFDNEWVHLRKSNTEPIKNTYFIGSVFVKLLSLNNKIAFCDAIFVKCFNAKVIIGIGI